MGAVTETSRIAVETEGGFDIVITHSRSDDSGMSGNHSSDEDSAIESTIILRRDSVEEIKDDTSSHCSSEIDLTKHFQQKQYLYDIPQVVRTDSSESEDSSDDEDEEVAHSLRPIPFRTFPSKSCLKRTCAYPTPTRTKKVCYDSITVHYHAVGLGDSPSVSKGPPLAMTWNKLATEVFCSLEKYEAQRPELRGKKKMRLRSLRREKVLLRAGVKVDEIRLCVAMVERLKREQEDNVKDDVKERTRPTRRSSFVKNRSRRNGTVLCGNMNEGAPRPESSLSSSLELLWLDWICASSANQTTK